MQQQRDVVIVGYGRTPIGRCGGARASVRPDSLAAHTLKIVVEQTGIDPAEVDDVILGCANQDKRYALVSMCIGVGQGIATILERAESGMSVTPVRRS
jgi:acetyl-CoA acetyltransferase